MNNNAKAIVILSKDMPSPAALEFYKTLKRDNYDIFIMIDYTVTLPESDDIIYLQVDDDICRKEGWVNANFVVTKNPNAWDKALYYFSTISKYSHVWFIEDDVFIPTNTTIYDIDSKYPNEDLLSERNEINRTGQLYWWWRHAQGKISLPWACSMVCAVRMSQTLLQKIKEYVDNHKTLLFIEFIFNTLALHNNLNVTTPIELREVIYTRSTPLTVVNPSYLYHPFKDINEQCALRKTLNK
jgi:hypothetical protein